jgi:hypothetical protein
MSWHYPYVKDSQELKKGEKWRGSNLIVSGIPNTILNEITKYLKISVTYYTIYSPDLPDRRSLKLFAEDVILNIRRR